GETRPPVRGRGWIEDLDGPRPKPNPTADARAHGPSGLHNGPAEVEGYVVLSATDADQLAQERSRPGMGLFTYHLVRALSDRHAIGPDTTYVDLLARVKPQVMADADRRGPQVPQAEGEIHQKILQSAVVTPEPSIAVEVNQEGLFL